MSILKRDIYVPVSHRKIKCEVRPWVHAKLYWTVSVSSTVSDCGGLTFSILSAAASVPKEAVIVDDTDPRLVWSEGWGTTHVSTITKHRTIFNYNWLVLLFYRRRQQHGQPTSILRNAVQRRLDLPSPSSSTARPPGTLPI